jgi:hypothetical protein
MQIELERFDSDKQCDDLIEEFCSTKSDKVYGDIRKRSSVLLQMLSDLKYVLGFPGAFSKLNLTHVQAQVLNAELLPILTPGLLFCSAIDLIARVSQKRVAKSNESKEFFAFSANKFFSLADDQIEELWKFRNAIVHQYSLSSGVALSRSGSIDNILIKGNSGVVIAVRPMLSSLELAMGTLKICLMRESQHEKKRSCLFIEKHGFIYYLVN